MQHNQPALLEAPEGLLATQLFREIESLQARDLPDQDVSGSVHSAWNYKSHWGLPQSLQTPGISQGPRETHENRGVLRVFVETCGRWRLNREDQVILLGFRPEDPVGMRVLDGLERSRSRDIRDRAAYVVAISVGLGILFDENVSAENEWLRRRRAALNGESPLGSMLMGRMTDLIAVNRMVELERGL